MHHDSGTGGSGRHHHARHPERKRSKYPDRLAARGLGKAPVMPDLDALRRRQSWMLAFVEGGTVKGAEFGPLVNPIPASRPADV